MGVKLFDKDGSVQATVDWVASFLGCSDYSVVLADDAVNGSALRRLAKDITGLKLIGFKSGQSANLLDYFERLDVHQAAATSSPTPDAVPITPIADPLADTTPHTHHRGSEPDCSRKNLHHPEPTNTGITYDQIFKEKAAGKVLLKTRYPLAWKNLHADHALIHAWFRHYETDPLQFDLLHENYRLNPDMKRKLNLFVLERISQLPLLVLVPGGETGTLSFEWKHETVYLHIIAHRQEFKKALKRRRSLSTADGDSDLELPPKKSQSSRPNSESVEDYERVSMKSANTDSRNVSGRDDDHPPAHPLSTRTSNLSEDEADMMSIIMVSSGSTHSKTGPPFNTCRCEIVEQPLTLPWNLSTSLVLVNRPKCVKIYPTRHMRSGLRTWSKDTINAFLSALSPILETQLESPCMFTSWTS
ncbi:hypothetical protein R1sor_022147 [Riccia sorocarpa]|uniref:Uncharacterized protein n=1 Tax=Riccia sorocarpa TaxID=122646 RepID=A0ABD3GKJ4_9MARC